MIKLGDLVDCITRYTGIKWLVRVVSDWFGIDCGCEARKENWNNITINRNGRNR